jgi:hypothetical protein
MFTGSALLELRNYTGARQYFDEALDIDPRCDLRISIYPLEIGTVHGEFIDENNLTTNIIFHLFRNRCVFVHFNEFRHISFGLNLNINTS